MSKRARGDIDVPNPPSLGPEASAAARAKVALNCAAKSSVFCTQQRPCYICGKPGHWAQTCALSCPVCDAKHGWHTCYSLSAEVGLPLLRELHLRQVHWLQMSPGNNALHFLVTHFNDLPVPFRQALKRGKYRCFKDIEEEGPAPRAEMPPPAARPPPADAVMPPATTSVIVQSGGTVVFWYGGSGVPGAAWPFSAAAQPPAPPAMALSAAAYAAAAPPPLCPARAAWPFHAAAPPPLRQAPPPPPPPTPSPPTASSLAPASPDGGCEPTQPSSPPTEQRRAPPSPPTVQRGEQPTPTSGQPDPPLRSPVPQLAMPQAAPQPVLAAAAAVALPPPESAPLATFSYAVLAAWLRLLYGTLTARGHICGDRGGADLLVFACGLLRLRVSGSPESAVTWLARLVYEKDRGHYMQSVPRAAHRGTPEGQARFWVMYNEPGRATDVVLGYALERLIANVAGRGGDAPTGSWVGAVRRRQPPPEN